VDLAARIVNYKGGRPTPVIILGFRVMQSVVTVFYMNKATGDLQWADVGQDGFIIDPDGTVTERVFRLGE